MSMTNQQKAQGGGERRIEGDTERQGNVKWMRKKREKTKSCRVYVHLVKGGAETHTFLFSSFSRKRQKHLSTERDR